MFLRGAHPSDRVRVYTIWENRTHLTVFSIFYVVLLFIDTMLTQSVNVMQEHFENLRKEFKSEVDLLSKIGHRNLVKLLGYVDKVDERLIITEYVGNGTLRDHLDGKNFVSTRSVAL